MAIYNIFTDPHEGLKRNSNTTQKSQQLFRDHLHEIAMELASKGEPFRTNRGGSICVGDLFDKSENSEDTILKGLAVAQQCKFVLAGNHDIKNITDSVTSFDVLKEALPSHVMIKSPDLSAPYYFCYEGFTFIPHCLNQSIFEYAIKIVCDLNKLGSEGKEVMQVLFLHCNVGDGFGDVDGEGSCLWLTSELQKLVVERFDFVLVGHEHEPRTLQDGKLVILGNTFPLSFGEIADRYYYTLDTEKKTLERTLSVAAADIFEEVPVELLFGTKGLHETTKLLIDIVGEINVNESAEYARYLSIFWKTNPHLLMVRKSVETRNMGKLVRECRIDKRGLFEVIREQLGERGFAAEMAELEGGPRDE